MKSQFSRWLPLFLSMALIFALSLDPDPYLLLPAPMRQPIQLVKPAPATDSAAPAVAIPALGVDDFFGAPGHVFEFLLLGVTAARALLWQRRVGFGALLLVFAGCLLYAVLDETVQNFVPGRAFELRDILLDGAGVLIGLILYGFVRHRLILREKRTSLPV